MSWSKTDPTPSQPGAQHGPGDPPREVVLVKNGQRYVFRYSSGDESKLLASLAEMARDPQCDLGWFDVAVLSHQMGKGMEQELQKRLKA